MRPSPSPVKRHAVEQEDVSGPRKRDALLMTRLDNPAGRLHALLTEYRAAANEQRSIRATWAHVLDVSESEVTVAVIDVGSLIPAIEAAVARVGDEAQQELLSYYRLNWAAPITTPDHPTGQTPSPGKALVDVGALTALGSLSSFLSSVASEGAVPDVEQIQSLRDSVAQVIDEVARTLSPLNSNDYS